MGNMKNDTTLLDHNIMSKRVSLADCKKLCLENSECKSIDYEVQHCRLHEEGSYNDILLTDCGRCVYYGKVCSEGRYGNELSRRELIRQSFFKASMTVSKDEKLTTQPPSSTNAFIATSTKENEQLSTPTDGSTILSETDAARPHHPETTQPL